MNIKLKKKFRKWGKGEVLTVTGELGNSLIDSGTAVRTDEDTLEIKHMFDFKKKERERAVKQAEDDYQTELEAMDKIEKKIKKSK